MDTLLEFMAKRKSPITNEVMKGRAVDLYKLYLIVVKHGGFTKVTQDCLWSEVSRKFKYQVNPCCFRLKKLYYNFLYSFECEKEEFTSLSNKIKGDIESVSIITISRTI